MFKNHNNVSLQFGDEIEPLPQLMNRIDLTISCGGSVLAESVAIYNKPCVAAFNFHQYSPYNFCINSESPEEYFMHLKNPDILNPPNKSQIYEAKFSMIYAYILASWPLDKNYIPIDKFDDPKIVSLFSSVYTDFETYFSSKLLINA